MKVDDRGIDVELTNRCNALCSFCPRSETPEQGFLTFDILKQVVARAKEVPTGPRISFTGQGEPTLHPELVEFVRYTVAEGVAVHMTTNANLLDKVKIRELIEAGLSGITFSISDFDEDYELVYNLSFEKTRTNILDFFDIRSEFPDRKISVMISIVVHDLNKPKIAHMRAYWESMGVDFIAQFAQGTRGGACDNAHYFMGNDRYLEEAVALLAERKVSTLCCLPFFSVFIGWNGQYYICCNDYRKEDPLGSVFDYSIDEMDQIKLKAMAGYLPACAKCDIAPVNLIRERMFQIEMGEISEAKLEDAINFQSAHNDRRLPRDIDILRWQDSIAQT